MLCGKLLICKKCKEVLYVTATTFPELYIHIHVLPAEHEYEWQRRMVENMYHYHLLHIARNMIRWWLFAYVWPL